MALILAIDGLAIGWVVAARTIVFESAGSGYPTAYGIACTMLDGSDVLVVHNYVTGTIVRRTVMRPATVAGLYRVWLPVLPAGLLSLVGLALALTRRGRRYVAEFRLPRFTLWRLMIVVPVLGAEAGLGLGTVMTCWHDLYDFQWTPRLFDRLMLHALVLVPVGVVLLFRVVRRFGSPKRPESVTF